MKDWKKIEAIVDAPSLGYYDCYYYNWRPAEGIILVFDRHIHSVKEFFTRGKIETLEADDEVALSMYVHNPKTGELIRNLDGLKRIEFESEFKLYSNPKDINKFLMAKELMK